MDTTSFLRRILPSDGFFVCIVINKDEKPRQGFFASVEELADNITQLNERGDNVYFAVSSFRDKTGGRKQGNVYKSKALYLDIDCGPGKPFADWKAGLAALGNFVQDKNLPKPMVISSGNGLHVYWVLDTELTPEEWQPLADKLKALIPIDPASSRPLFDPAVPADSARVLRPVGTINRKGDKPVRLLIDAQPVSLSIMQSHLGYTSRPKVVQPTQSPLLSAMAVKQEFPPANPAALESKCAQIAWAVSNQKDVLEPFWYALLGVAAFCENPEDTARAWSRGHPQYDETKTIRKLEQWREKASGPTTCSRFKDERPEGCKKCRFWDRITSPAQLGLQYEQVEVAPDAPDEMANAVPTPSAYVRTAQGMKRVLDGTHVDVCSFDIYPIGYGRDENLGYETVRYRWNRPHVGWQTLAFRQAFLPDHAVREFASTIADQGIVLFNKSQTESFQQMLRSYMDELRKMRSMTNLYSTMGWKENNTQFLLGDTIIRQDENGSAVKDTATISTTTQRTVDSMYGVSGTAEEWAMGTSILEKADMRIHMFALCVSLSAPLYQFTGLKGLTINLYGQTGAGKTLAQLWQQSVWGDPTKLHYTAKFTQNALFSRMGLYNNLPVTIDETTMLPPKEVGDFLYWVSQGRDKARLSRNAEERDHKTWATVVTTSSNRSMSSMLVASGLETDAQMARLLEITIHPHRLFTRSTEGGKRIFDFITTHYGAVGMAFMEHLVSLGEAGVRAAIDRHRALFNAKYNCTFTGNERFWEQCIVLADLAGSIAADLGLIQFDYTKGTVEVLTQIGAMRKAVKDNVYDHFDLLAEYLNEFSSATLQVIHSGASKPFISETRFPRGELHIRYDLYGSGNSLTGPFDRGVVMLDRRHFKHWMATKGADYRAFIQEITLQGINATPQSEKAYLGKDSSIKLGQQYVVGISLNHPRLVGILRDADSLAIADTASSSVVSVLGGWKP